MSTQAAPPPVITIEAFVEHDRLACQALAARAARSSYGPRLPEAIRRTIDEAAPLEAVERRLVAKVDGAPAGMIDLNGSHIENLFVDPLHQGRGIGSALLAAAERTCPGDVTLSVFTVNPDARRLYERLGYEVTGTRLVTVAGQAAEVWSMRKLRAAGDDRR